MTAFVFLTATAGTFLIAAYFVVRVGNDVALLVTLSAGTSRRMRRVPVRSNHDSPCQSLASKGIPCKISVFEIIWRAQNHAKYRVVAFLVRA